MNKINFSSKKSIKVILLLTGLTFFAIVVFGFASNEKSKNEQTVLKNKKVQAEVAFPIFETVKIWDEYTGRFTASKKVEVRARVGGYIDKVNFRDGQMVNKGDVLFTIDNRPFKIALYQANAKYNRNFVSLQKAQNEFNRVKSLQGSGAVSTEEFERRKQELEYAKSNVQLSKAEVDEAKLNLEFTNVKAPITGLVSRDKINVGNLIDGGTSNATVLTTIVSISPIYFYFTGSESDYLKYIRTTKNNLRNSIRTEEGSEILLKLQDEESFTHKAKLDFLENEIDNSTGTIEMRAVIKNKDNLMKPGMYGEAKVRIFGEDIESKSIMIPDDIIGTNQSLRFVYTLGENNRVITKNITLGPLSSNGLRVIKNGLSPTDKLIVSNIQKISSGVIISPIETSLQNNLKTELK